MTPADSPSRAVPRRLRLLLALAALLACVAAIDVFWSSENAPPSPSGGVDWGAAGDGFSGAALIDGVAARLDQGPDRETLALRLETTRRIAERRAALAAEVAQLRQAIETDPRFLPGGPLAAAQAAAQKRIDAASASVGVRLAQMRWAETAVDELSIEIAADGSYDALLGFIAALETGAPAFFLERLSMAAADDLSGLSADRLRLTARLLGWRRPDLTRPDGSPP